MPIQRLARCGLIRELLSELPAHIAAMWHWPLWDFNLLLWWTGWGLSLCTQIIPCHKLPAAYCLHSVTRSLSHHHSPGGAASTLADAQPQICYCWGLRVGLGLFLHGCLRPRVQWLQCLHHFLCRQSFQKQKEVISTVLSLWIKAIQFLN